MAGKKKQEKIGDALLKVALGYRLQEITEEYAEVDGKFKLTRRKETKKDIPPDLKAVQLLLASDSEDLSSMSEEQLERERQRLLDELKSSEDKKRAGTKSKPETPPYRKEKTETGENRPRQLKRTRTGTRKRRKKAETGENRPRQLKRAGTGTRKKREKTEAGEK